MVLDIMIYLYYTKVHHFPRCNFGRIYIDEPRFVDLEQGPITPDIVSTNIFSKYQTIFHKNRIIHFNMSCKND